MVMPDGRSAEFATLVEEIKRSRAATVGDAERVAKNGRRLRVASTVSPIRDPSGRLIGLAAIERDLADHK
jgi:PAS domain S-box-containing protein